MLKPETYGRFWIDEYTNVEEYREKIKEFLVMKNFDDKTYFLIGEWTRNHMHKFENNWKPFN